MIAYVMRRVGAALPILIGITAVSFGVMHLAPGRPTDLQAALNPKVSLEARERLEELYGFNRPLPVQYADWLWRIVRLDFGRSFLDDRPVAEKILERLPITVGINVLSLGIILLVALPLGVVSAVHRGSPLDHVTTVFVFVGFAMPTFWLALLLMSLFGARLGWLPVLGLVSLDHEALSWIGRIGDVARHLLLPLFVATFGELAGLSRYMRSAMTEALHQDYVRTARAKGLSERQVVYGHALRNALLPLVTILGLSVPGLIGGSVIFETIFAIPGMGQLFYTAVMSRDYAVVMGMLVIGSALTLVGNLLADVAYAAVDPRIRVGREG